MTVAVDRAKYKIRAPYPGLQGLFAAVDAAVVVFKVSSSGFHGIAVACTHAGTSPHHKDTLVHERGWAVFTDRGIPGDGIRNKEGHGRRACPRTCFQGFKIPALVFPFGLQLADPFGEGLVFFLETPYPLIEKVEGLPRAFLFFGRKGRSVAQSPKMLLEQAHFSLHAFSFLYLFPLNLPKVFPL
jgi:hypothetical protein